MTGTRRRVLLALGALVIAGFGIGGGAPGRGALVQGSARIEGFGAATVATSPNGTRLMVTGDCYSGFESTAPNGTRLVLGVLPDRHDGIGSGFTIY